MTQPLLIVDVQSGFINDFTHHIPQRLVRLIEGGGRDPAKRHCSLPLREYEPILFTRFINQIDSPYQRLLDWHSCADCPETNVVEELSKYAQPELIFSKPGLCGLSDELSQYLQKAKIEKVFVAGIDTDMCVLKIALDLFDLGIEPFILTDCCASTAGLQAHLAGLAVLSRNIGATRLIEAGVGGGLLAAPPK